MEYAADDVILDIVSNEATEGGTRHWVGDTLADVSLQGLSKSNGNLGE